MTIILYFITLQTEVFSCQLTMCCLEPLKPIIININLNKWQNKHILLAPQALQSYNSKLLIGTIRNENFLLNIKLSL